MLKKQNAQKKLILNKTTLRALDAGPLSLVAGGTDILHSVGRFCVIQVATMEDPCNG